MGKQAKKKEKTSTDQQKHNRATRYSRSKRRPIVWSSAYDKEGVRHDVTVPPNTQWDWSLTHDAVTLEDGKTKLMPRKPRPKLYEPYDRLMDNWSDNLTGFAEYHGAKIDREIVEPGLFLYTVYHEIPGRSGRKGKTREVILTVESGKNLNFRSQRKRRKRK